ncbi:hypothetical protein DL98DRAFT_535188 [Cadophora sp. DSE1049]|nr:hypothetical protein DL98DRAFT_535188 [Cadophora sp. DSE1049]
MNCSTDEGESTNYSKSGWVLLNCVGPSTVHFVSSGEGDASEIVPQLEDNQVQFGLVRLYVNNAVKDVLFEWIGPGVGLVEEATLRPGGPRIPPTVSGCGRGHEEGNFYY